MRDPDLLLSLLREMAATEYGRISVVQGIGMSNKQQRRVHHVELLADAGLVEWLPPKLPRITNDGYDFIEVVDKNKSSMDKFLELIEKGWPLAQAVLGAIQAVSG